MRMKQRQTEHKSGRVLVDCDHIALLLPARNSLIMVDRVVDYRGRGERAFVRGATCRKHGTGARGSFRGQEDLARSVHDRGAATELHDLQCLGPS